VMNEGAAVYHEDASYFSQRAEALLAFRPSFIGGCCGTTPEHIKALRKIIDDAPFNSQPSLPPRNVH
jgi:methionine synthase I (cobalamin-dependent)